MNRATGLDLSYYDLSFDSEKATKPINFVIQRVTLGFQSGKIDRDSALDKLYTGVQKVGIRGAYHYLSSHSDWKAQADFFLNVVKNYDYQFYACDFESAYNDMSAQFSQDANLWMEYVAGKTNKKVLFYTNKSLYDTYGYMYCSEWPLWYAQYWKFPLLYKNPSLPKKRTSGEWSIWQWASELNYVGHSKEYGCGALSVDINDFNGTVVDMQNRLGNTQPPPPSPTTTWYKVVNSAGLNVRSGAGTGFSIKYWMANGTRFQVINKINAGGYDWLELLTDGFSAEKYIPTNKIFAVAE